MLEVLISSKFLIKLVKEEVRIIKKQSRMIFKQIKLQKKKN